jgi:hypothetical protein
MAAIPWVDHVRSRKRLTVFQHQSMRAGAWGGLFKKSIDEFNKLADVHKLGVKLDPARDDDPPSQEIDGGGADIQMETATTVARGRGMGEPFSERFSGTEIHGLTWVVRVRFAADGPRFIAKAFIFLPATPQIRGKSANPAKNPYGPMREVGEGLRLVIAVHELIHAVSGLNNSDHSPGNNPDIFVGPPVYYPGVDAGDTPDGDKLTTGSARAEPNFKRFPPLELTARTVGLIQPVWK